MKDTTIMLNIFLSHWIEDLRIKRNDRNPNTNANKCQFSAEWIHITLLQNIDTKRTWNFESWWDIIFDLWIQVHTYVISLYE